ncbi:MAG: SPFH/Band 7/PHB domain protein [Bacteroidales bacterium]|jgi:regulator of protease activity HflC (stomatin/prohibitin superfamily)|nr:SPFH/Band 7/PHB domain protein [Bacteroidales bacterium]
MVYFFIAIAILAMLFTLAGIRIVQQSENVIIERLGKYNRTLSAGINIIIPIIDRPRSIMWRYTREGYDGRSYVIKRAVNKIDIRETVYDFPRQNVITKDNVVTEINAILYFQIIDPVKAVYEISNLPDAIEKLTQTTLRNVIGDMNLDETLTSRDTINSKLRTVLDDASHKWGVKVNRVELQDINPPHDIRDAMEKQMRAERDKRAKILTAEAEKQSQILHSEGLKLAAINKAEGEKQSQILRAEGDAEARIRTAQGEAEAIDKIINAVSAKGDPINYLVAIRYIDTLKEMVSGQDNKMVYIPYEATGILGSIGGIKDMIAASK